MTLSSYLHRSATFLQTLADTAVLGADWVSLERPTLRIRPRPRRSRHLALFAGALPPHSSAGVYRPLSFLRHGSQVGWRINAFCSEATVEQAKQGDELLARVPRGVALNVVPHSSREPSYRFFPRVDGGFSTALEFARYATSLLVNDPPDVVLASGPPFFTFVAALFVSRRFGVPLVLDYRDEWTECPFDFVCKDGSDRVWERRCLRNAEAVLFTTESHLQHQLATFPELDRARTHLVPNGWDATDFVESQRNVTTGEPRRAATLRVAHVGNLAGHAPPHEFLDSLQQILTDEPAWVSRIRVQFIGRHSEGADKALRAFKFPSVVEVIDHVGKREANRRMQDSDALLLLAAPDLERYLPGKLFDYLAARRPVLVFGSAGESAALVERLGAGVLCPPRSAAALRDAFVRIQNLNLPADDESGLQWLRAHRRDVLAARAFDILESLTLRA